MHSDLSGEMAKILKSFMNFFPKVYNIFLNLFTSKLLLFVGVSLGSFHAWNSCQKVHIKNLC